MPEAVRPYNDDLTPCRTFSLPRCRFMSLHQPLLLGSASRFACAARFSSSAS